MQDLFERRRPEVVFHAAALKHLPMLERSPGEAVKTNVWGTQNVLNAAAPLGVERFVNISTDKAADPCSVLGHSKRLAEGLTSAAAQRDRRALHERAVRQRPGQPRFGADDVHRADRARWAGHRHRPRRHPLLHDDRRGRAAGHPGRRDRRRRRRAGARHGRAGVDRRGGPAADRPRRQARRHRLHRPATGREAPRAAVQHRRGRPAAAPPADLARAGPALRAVRGGAADAVRLSVRRTSAAGGGHR